MASPFKQNKKERRRARKSAAKAAQILEKWEAHPEIVASSKRTEEIMLRIAQAKRVQNKRFTPINKKMPEQLEKMKERLSQAEELALHAQDLLRKAQALQKS